MKRKVRSGPRGGTPRELARSGRGALTPKRRPGARRASTKGLAIYIFIQYWHHTGAQPSARGVARGGVLRTQRTTQPSCMCTFDDF
jgi:hypothetical protein